MAANQPLVALLGDDLKHVLHIDVDVTGVGTLLSISAGPDQPQILSLDGTILDTHTDDDGVTSSSIQFFAAQADVETAVTSVGGLPGNDPLVLFYQVQFASIPGDAGTAARITLLCGEYIVKGSVNG